MIKLGDKSTGSMSAQVDVDLVLCMVTLPPLPIFPNNYMLDSSTTHKKETVWVENTASFIGKTWKITYITHNIFPLQHDSNIKWYHKHRIACSVWVSVKSNWYYATFYLFVALAEHYYLIYQQVMRINQSSLKTFIIYLM